MALPASRAAGNIARANPRLYSTQSEASFTHRNPPPIPSFDHILQPGRDFVQILSHRIHSVLGSAWHALNQPFPMLEEFAQPATKPAAVAVENPIMSVALQTTQESSKDWTWHEDNFSNIDKQVKIYEAPKPSPLEKAKTQMSKLEALRSSLLQQSFLELYSCAAVDVAIQSNIRKDLHDRFEMTQNMALSHFWAPPEVALVRVPAHHRSLDGHSTPPPPPTIERVPLYGDSERANMITLAIVATGVAVASTVAAVGYIGSVWKNMF